MLAAPPVGVGTGPDNLDQKDNAMNTVARCFAVLSLVATVFVPAASAWAPHGAHATARPAASTKINETSAALRDLWVGHVFWVRNVAVSTLAGNQAAAATAEREVVANAKRIAGAIEPYYGTGASETMFGLLARHYGAIKEYLEATGRGSTDGQGAAYERLNVNASEIARFLSGANPNLPFDTVNGLLLAHGGHHVQQIQALQAGQYAEEARTWEAMTRHIYVIADALAEAIAKQFPKEFS